MSTSRAFTWLLTVALLCLWSTDAPAKKRRKRPKKPAPAAKAEPAKDKKKSKTKIIPAEAFTAALLKLADDERVPVASSTLVEKGRGPDYYGVEKMLDTNPATYWAEGAKGWGKNEWVAFHLPEESTHVEVTPGAGPEDFENFNRPKRLFLDVYLVKLKRDEETDKYKPEFKWLGRSKYKFKDQSRTVRQKLPVKVPQLAMAARTMYVGVLILQKVYKGQFDDTSIAELRATSVWGAE